MKKNSIILKKASSFGSVTGISRVLGLVREIVFARFFGTSIFADAFVTSFVFPNLFRKLFGEGALSGSFIPIFSDQYHKDKESAWSLLSTILTLVFIVLSLLALLVTIGLTIAIHFTSSVRIIYILQLSQIMFPYVILICTIGFMFGIFNYFGHYALPAASSVITNLLFITGIFASIYIFDVKLLFTTSKPHLSVYSLCGNILTTASLELGKVVMMYYLIASQFLTSARCAV